MNVKDGERKRVLEGLKQLDAALIFYESPQRIVSALGCIAEAFPLRRVAVCRELTKVHEEVYRDFAPAVRDEFALRAETGSIKGEIVIVIDAPTDEERNAAHDEQANDAAVRAQELIAEGALSKKDIVKTLRVEFGISRNEAYELVIGQF